MESLHYGKILGMNCINNGLCWGITTGIYCVNLEGKGVAVRGCGPPICRGSDFADLKVFVLLAP